MTLFNLFLILSLLHITLIYILKKFNFLIDAHSKHQHKIKIKKTIPLTGGIYLIAGLSIINIFYDNFINNYILLTLIPFFLLGYFSDTKADFSPKIRLIFQIIVILFFIKFNNIEIIKTNIFFIDKFIQFNIFNIFFTSFCFLVILNGFNFCDGVNCNVTGYCIAILLNVLIFNLFDFYYIILLTILLSILYIFNLSYKSFLGDNGVYVLSPIICYIVIEISNQNLATLKPLLAVNLLWYPAFENLFTIIRRLSFNKKIQIADKLHLHTLIYNYLKIKIKYKNYLANSITGVLINSYNFFTIYLCLSNKNNIQALTLILIINIFIYVLIYLRLFKIFSKVPE